MFEAWGRIIFRRRRLVIAVGVIAVVLAAIWGTGVFGRLQSAGGFVPPGSESQQEANLAAKSFGPAAGDVVLLYTSASQTVRSPAYKAAVSASLAGLPGSRIRSAQTYWSTGSPAFVSANGRVTYALLELAGGGDAAKIKNFDAIQRDLSAPGLTVQAGGQIPTEAAINKEVTSDIGRAEGISLPVLLVLLLVIFGSLAAASLPLAVGGIGIIGSFAALRLLTLATPVSIYSVNITTILGLGLAIDYGLFMVGRFREELRRQHTVEEALARTVATAGRTVAVSGITVAMALASLLLFPEAFLRSMGYGGVATVIVDMLAALTVLPALLAVLGHRVNALRIRRSLPGPVSRTVVSQKAVSQTAEAAGGWYRLARSVMRRPAAYALVIVVVLLALGAPVLHISWGGTDARVLPATAPARQVTEALNRDFPGNVTAPVESLVQFNDPVANSPSRQSHLTAYISTLRQVPGVTGARLTGVRGDTARIDLSYGPDPLSAQARQIVQRVRGIASPAGARAYVGGQSAQLVDELSSLSATVPWMALVMAAATFVLLFLAFGSVVLPVKAIVMNVLSLSATFGVVVWIFQEGHLSGPLQFAATGTIDPTMPILMLAIIFGLSTDYEVFLLSRIRERYDVTGHNAEAIASGLQRTGGVITSAALLLVIVVGAFSASGITFIKLMGVGMIVALIVDASIVRVMLVPATMRLLGRANWWAPAPLRRLYARYGIRENDDPVAAPVQPAAAVPGG
ncbi:MAG TPA: MMPL family transporter [Streptosporangiaceae bacterium]|nr:MMPL family transporter [Streptosporangiaceae bacterium]